MTTEADSTELVALPFKNLGKKPKDKSLDKVKGKQRKKSVKVMDLYLKLKGSKVENNDD